MASDVTSLVDEVPRHVAETDHGLGVYLRGLVACGCPDTREQLPPAPTVRCWPARGRQSPVRQLDIISRHPEFYPGWDGVPAEESRRLSRTVKRGWRGAFQSRKMGRPIRHHSGLELHLLRCCEVDSAVTAFCEHPARLHVPIPEGGRTVCFSAYAERAGERWLLACRWEAGAASADNEGRWSRLAERCNAAGFGFAVLTEAHFAPSQLQRSISDVLRGRWASQVSVTVRDRLLRLARGGCTITKAEHIGGVGRDQLYQMVLDRILFTDLRAPLQDDTLLSAEPLGFKSPLWSGQ